LLSHTVQIPLSLSSSLSALPFLSLSLTPSLHLILSFPPSISHFLHLSLSPLLSLQGSREFDVVCPFSLGKLVLIELDKQPLPLFPLDAWFPSKVVVTTPERGTCQFPIYRWIMDKEVHLFREGTGQHSVTL
jgi:hypothetical protein